ncbi:hypothetical protein CPC08DRAFT_764621 [Agrocybe pediades]|nr:hypothetical protein CPC08DRAFT_764621 [Agrocybe pediades]
MEQDMFVVNMRNTIVYEAVKLREFRLDLDDDEDEDLEEDNEPGGLRERGIGGEIIGFDDDLVVEGSDTSFTTSFTSLSSSCTSSSPSSTTSNSPSATPSARKGRLQTNSEQGILDLEFSVLFFPFQHAKTVLFFFALNLEPCSA